MARDFTVGDVVRLKSGGPTMTVSSDDRSKGLLHCIWFNQANGVHTVEGKTFKPETLQASKPD